MKEDSFGQSQCGPSFETPLRGSSGWGRKP